MLRLPGTTTEDTCDYGFTRSCRTLDERQVDAISCGAALKAIREREARPASRETRTAHPAPVPPRISLRSSLRRQARRAGAARARFQRVEGAAQAGELALQVRGGGDGSRVGGVVELFGERLGLFLDRREP
ncbi:hypothetical protein GA0115257_10166 [Streptomyces sp. LcepLS]|nr:hypothetical protein GA0115257_10166 [Streptomyces sp. LcepLS]